MFFISYYLLDVLSPPNITENLEILFEVLEEKTGGARPGGYSRLAWRRLIFLFEMPSSCIAMRITESR